MAHYTVEVLWLRGEQNFLDNRYSRRHSLRFDGGVVVPASSSPHIVPLPLSDAAAVDPEEAFVAALSSCHMLWFLSLAAQKGFCVDRYLDQALGIMARDDAGRLAMTRVTLKPDASFAGHPVPTREQIDQLHHEAHQACFIANSVRTSVRCEPVYPALEQDATGMDSPATGAPPRAATASGGPGAVTATAGETQRNKEVVRAFVDALNARDWVALERLVVPGFVRHSAAAGQPGVRSRADLLAFLQKEYETFPDAQERIQDLVAEGAKVAARHAFSGTQNGHLGLHPPSGRSLASEYLVIYRLEGGRIIEAWAEWDNLSALVQLGHWQ